jgi:hypothetical protein
MTSAEHHSLAPEPYSKVRDLDPLQLDSFFATLPDINEQGDVETIVHEVHRALSIAAIENEIDGHTALACLRDLDFLLSSSLRHGRNLIPEIDQLEDILIMLGERADTIPRGTVTTYGMANPTDERQRSFTGSEIEATFIKSVSDGAYALEDAMETYAYRGRLAGLQSIDRGLDVMIDSIVTVRRQVSPEYFTNVLRPYFEPLVINNTEYHGSGGAQLQFIAIDFLLWGLDDDSEEYSEYFMNNLSYLSSQQRLHLGRSMSMHNGESLLTYLKNNDDPEMADACLSVLKKLKKFRLPHKRVAEDNFKLRTKDQVGSGSYRTDILSILIDKTVNAIDEIEKIYGTQN